MQNCLAYSINMLLTIHFFCISILLFSCNKNVLNSDQDQPDDLNYLIKPTEVTKIDDDCDESSGLEFYDGKFYTHNDSGGKEEIYALDEEGDIVETLQLEQTKNVDWEDISQDEDYFYIAETGNNVGNREDLRIYKFDKEDKGKIKDIETIEISYAEQTSFKKQNHSHSFDAEALITAEENLYLFSKDWLELKTGVYQIDKNEKNQKLTSIASYPIQALISGADYDEEGKTLVLCGYLEFENFLFVFEDVQPDNFFENAPKKIQLQGLNMAQVEGVCIVGDSIYFSTERTDAFEPQIWKILLSDLN